MTDNDKKVGWQLFYLSQSSQRAQRKTQVNHEGREGHKEEQLYMNARIAQRLNGKPLKTKASELTFVLRCFPFCPDEHIGTPASQGP